MSEKRIVVWVQQFKDRNNLMLQWIDPATNKRRSVSAGTNDPKVAETKRAEKEYELNHGMHKETSRMPWERFRELFEEEYVSGKRPNTRLNFTATFDSFERLCNPVSLRAISARTLSAYVGALRQQPGRCSPLTLESTIKVRLQMLRTALNWAAKQKLIPECPAFPSIRPPKRKPQPVSTEVFERLLAKAPDENMRVFLLAGWLAGLRLNEACCLEWEEAEKTPYLDLARERIVFPAGFVKADEDQWVPLDRELREAILSLPRQGKKVFPFLDDKGQPVTTRAVGIRVARLGKLAGVKMTMKFLRRGFGCYWAARVPAQVLQKLMRHHNITTTMTYYANVDDAATQAVFGREPSGLNKGKSGRIRNTLRNSEAGQPIQQEREKPSNSDSITG